MLLELQGVFCVSDFNHFFLGSTSAGAVYLSFFLLGYLQGKSANKCIKVCGFPYLLSVPTCLTPTKSHWVWWLTPAFWKLRPEAHCKFKASMGHIVKFQASLGNTVRPCLIKLILIPKQKPTTTILPLYHHPAP